MRLKFLHGLDDDMREQALKDFWQENKKYIIGGFAVLFLSYGAGQGYNHYQANKQDANALGYHQASQMDTPEAYTGFAETAPAGFEGLALFKAAEALIEEDKHQAAAERFSRIRENSSLPELWQHLAAIREAELLLRFSPAKSQEILAELVADDSPYQHTAYELLATEAQNRAAYDEAAAYYEKLLSMTNLADGMRQAIKQRLSYLEGKGFISATGQTSDTGEGTN